MDMPHAQPKTPEPQPFLPIPPLFNNRPGQAVFARSTKLLGVAARNAMMTF
jgi:hypothetical protein